MKRERKTSKRRSGAAKGARGARPRPLATHSGKVAPEWIDFNGHMNLSYYVLLFDFGTDGFHEYLGLGEAFRTRHQASTFAAEMHVNYLRELHAGDPVRITTQLLDHDERRIHYFHCMYHGTEGFLAATSELMSLYVDMRARRVASMPASIQRRLAALQRQHGKLPRPEQAGRSIGIRRR